MLQYFPIAYPAWHVDEIRLDAAAMLMDRGEFEDAEALLAPLTVSPHSRGNAAAAKDLLARARARERPGQAAMEGVAGRGDGAASCEPCNGALEAAPHSKTSRKDEYEHQSR
jgi:hypothetical protein